jgi:hypothetical protein
VRISDNKVVQLIEFETEDKVVLLNETVHAEILLNFFEIQPLIEALNYFYSRMRLPPDKPEDGTNKDGSSAMPNETVANDSEVEESQVEEAEEEDAEDGENDAKDE